jgi:ferredoxin
MEKVLREKVKELLKSGSVRVIIGYEQGSVPFKCTPLFVETEEEADRLIWNPTCVNNLAVYLPQVVSQGKVGIITKPCDVKSVVELIKEHKINREDVVILVVPCPGVLNLAGLSDIDLRDVKSVEWGNEGIIVETTDGKVEIPKEKAFMSKCLSCTIGKAPLADIELGESPIRNPIVDKYANIEDYEKLSPEEKRAFWAKQFARCIRCYACRQVCPACYCKECFVDKKGQLWALRSIDPTSNWFFHTARMMHLAGRCIGCGECERACPMGIPLSLLGAKLDKEVKEMFGSTPGEDPDALPVLGCFEMSDPDPCSE